MQTASVSPLRASIQPRFSPQSGCSIAPRTATQLASSHLRLIEGGLVFRQQLELTAPALLPHALRLTHNRERARDLIQDTCVRALRFEASFAPGTYFKAWLRQVMYSVFVSNCRRHKREREVALAWLADPSRSNQDSTATQIGLLPGLKRALDGLPQVYGRTLTLVDLEDCSYQEAATSLGVPLGTVMSRLHRARRLLGEQLAAEAA